MESRANSRFECGYSRVIPRMTWILAGCLGVLCAPLVRGQQTTREIRESANARLAAGDFEAAIGDLQLLVAILGDTRRDDVRAGLEHVFYSLALCHFLTGGFTEAESAFREYLRRYPHGGKVPDAWAFLGDAQRFAEKPQEAIRTYTEALRRFSYGFDLRADLFAGIARCHLMQGDWDSAIPALLNTYRSAPDVFRRSWAATLLSTAYLKTVDLPKLYPLVPSLLTQGSFASRSIAFNLAAIEAGDELFSEERYRESLWVHRLVYPHDVVVARSEEYLEFLQRRVEFERRRPGNPRVLMRLQENIGELEAELEVIHQIENYDIELQYRIARGYMEQLRYREACELFVNLHEVATGEMAEESLFLAFQCATQFQPWARAYEIGKRSMERYPAGKWFDPLTLTMGQMYAREEDWPNTLAHLLRSLEIHPEHQLEADCRFLLGYACFMEERFEEAVRHLRILREKYPQHDLIAAATYWCGMAWLFDGDYAEAAGEFDEVLLRHPGSQYVEDAAFRRAVCAYGLTHYEDADSRLQAFVDAHPQSRLVGEALMMRGDVAGVFGAADDAVRFYGQAMEHDALNIEHYNHCAFQATRILMDAERYEEAHRFLLGYIERDRPESNIPLAVYWIGRCILQTGGEAAALQYYQDSMTAAGRDRHQVGVDMILDEWIGLARRAGADASRLAWRQLRQGLVEARRRGDRTTLLRLMRVLLYDPALSEEDLQRLRDELVREDIFDDASPAVLQFVIDSARESRNHELARAGARRMIDDFAETDYALDARMLLAEYAILELPLHAPGSEQATGLRAEAIRHLGVVREVYATSGEAGRGLLLLGRLFREQRQFREAEQAYTDVLGVREWRPLWPEALYGRGLNAMQERRYLEACAFFERIYLMYGGYRDWAAKAYLRRAECLERLRDPQGAIETLRDMLDQEDYARLPEAEEARAMISRLGERQ